MTSSLCGEQPRWNVSQIDGIYFTYPTGNEITKKRFGKGRTFKQNLKGDWISHVCVTFKVG